MRENKLRLKSVLTVFMIAIVLMSVLAACGNATDSAEVPRDSKVFSNSGINITLSKDFKESPQEGYTVCYESQEVAVFALKEATADYPVLKDYTLERYTEEILEVNASYSPTVVTEIHGFPSFTYSFTDPDTGDVYSYFTALYQAPDGFWMVQFATFEEFYAKDEEQFIEWAKMITFDE